MNPTFNPTTTISFYIGERGKVTLTIYNILGERVRTLVDGNLEAGSHAVIWNGTDHIGHQVASGIYLYRLNIDDQVMTKKMSLVK